MLDMALFDLDFAGGTTLGFVLFFYPFVSSTIGAHLYLKIQILYYNYFNELNGYLFLIIYFKSLLDRKIST